MISDQIVITLREAGASRVSDALGRVGSAQQDVKAKTEGAGKAYAAALRDLQRAAAQQEKLERSIARSQGAAEKAQLGASRRIVDGIKKDQDRRLAAVASATKAREAAERARIRESVAGVQAQAQGERRLTAFIREGERAAKAAGSGRAASARRVVTGLHSVMAVAQMSAQAIMGMAQSIAGLAQEGAKLKGIEASFAAMGGTAAQMQQMRDATGGLISDADLQKASNMANLFGITGQNFDDLTQFAIGASMATGESMGKMLSDTMTATARGSVMILDNMGVQMGSLEAIHKKYAQNAGVSVESLTDKQKQQAFINATLEKGTKQLALAERAKNNEMAKSVATFENVSNELKKMVAETVMGSGVLEMLPPIVAMIGEAMVFIRPLLQMAIQHFASLAPPIMATIEALMPLLAVTTQMTPVVSGLVSALAAVVQVVAPIVAVIMQLVNLAMLPLILTIEGLLASLASAADALGMDGIGASLASASKGFGDARRNIMSFGVAQTEAQAQTEAATVAIAAQTAGVTASGGALDEQIKKLDDFIGKQKLAQTGTGELADAMRAGLAPAHEASSQLELHEEALKRYEGAMKAGGAAMDDLRGVYKNYAASFDDISKSTDEADLKSRLMQRALSATGGDAQKAAALLHEYSATVMASTQAMSHLDVRAQAMGQALKNAAEEGIGALADMAIEKAIEDAAKKDKKHGKGSGDARRKLILEAELIGMTEVERRVRSVTTQLAKDMDTAGKSIKAQLAAQMIADDQLVSLAAGSFALAGEVFGAAIGRGIDSKLDEWEQNKLEARAVSIGETMRELFALTQAGVSAGVADLGELALASADSLDSMGTRARAVFSIMIPEALAGMGPAVEQTRAQFDALASQFDGENPDGYHARLLQFATATETIGVAVADNFDVISDSLFDLGAAFAAMGDDAVSSADATAAAFSALSGAAGGAINIGRAAAGAIIQDKKKLAKIYGIFEIAEAIRSAASLDFLGAALHGIAAVKYFAVSGGGAGAPRASKSSSASNRQSQRTQLGGGTAMIDRRSQAPQQINQYFFSALDSTPPGDAVMRAINKSSKSRSGQRIRSSAVGSDNVTGL
jgi:hypothetical protein